MNAISHFRRNREPPHCLRRRKRQEMFARGGGEEQLDPKTVTNKSQIVQKKGAVLAYHSACSSAGSPNERLANKPCTSLPIF
jgi:hypothetical protein